MSVIGSTYEEGRIKSWVEDTLVSEDDGATYFDLYQDYKTRQSKFGLETVLYSTPVGENLMSSMINGIAKPAGFDYSDLLKSIQDSIEDEECHWVHVNEPDNCMAVVESVYGHDWQHSLVHHLIDFELNQAAEGGCTHLCLVPASKQWLLAHELNPLNDFTIALHADEALRDKVLKGLGVSAARDVRAHA